MDKLNSQVKRENIRNKCIIFGNDKETKQTKNYPPVDHHGGSVWDDSDFQPQHGSLRMVHAAHLPWDCNHPVHAFGPFSLFNLRPVCHCGGTLSLKARSVFNLQKDRF